VTTKPGSRDLDGGLSMASHSASARARVLLVVVSAESQSTSFICDGVGHVQPDEPLRSEPHCARFSVTESEEGVVLAGRSHRGARIASRLREQGGLHAWNVEVLKDRTTTKRRVSDALRGAVTDRYMSG